MIFFLLTTDYIMLYFMQFSDRWKTYYDPSLTEIEKSSLIRSINSLSSEFASNNTAPISNDRRIIEIL